MIRAPEHIATDRLLLRKPVFADGRAIYDTYAHDPEVTRYLTWRANQTSDEIDGFVRHALENWSSGTSYIWAITLMHSEELIGMIEARIDRWHINLGYVLARRYWDQGYMSEAVRAVTDWALAQPDVYRVWAVCDTENSASARVLEKAGMQKEGILRRWILLPNRSSTPRDCACYARVK